MYPSTLLVCYWKGFRSRLERQAELWISFICGLLPPLLDARFADYGYDSWLIARLDNLKYSIPSVYGLWTVHTGTIHCTVQTTRTYLPPLRI